MWDNNYCEEHATAVELHLTRAIKCTFNFFALETKAQFRAQEKVSLIIIASVVTLTRVASRLLTFAIQATPDSGGRERPSSRSRLQLVPEFLLHAHANYNATF